VIDLNNVHQKTRYTTCIGEDLGGSGNPSIATGKGTFLNVVSVSQKQCGDVAIFGQKLKLALYSSCT
jgi:glutamate dehydrogenase/leucine dehydrogenase